MSTCSEDPDDPGVPEPAEVHDLSLEALVRPLRAVLRDGDHLDGNEPRADGVVLGQVDAPHSAAAELADDLVGPDPLVGTERGRPGESGYGQRRGVRRRLVWPGTRRRRRASLALFLFVRAPAVQGFLPVLTEPE